MQLARYHIGAHPRGGESLWSLALLRLQDMWVTVLNLSLIFLGLWINSLPLNLACSFDLPPSSRRRSKVFRCFSVLENETLSFFGGRMWDPRNE